MDSPSLLRLTSAVGLSSAFWISGIGFSASHLTLPSLYTLPSKPALQVFKGVFYDGAAVVVPVTALGTVSFATAAYLSPRASPAGSILAGPRVRYIAASVFAIISLPYTQLVMMEGIKILLECADSEAARTRVGDATIGRLLRAWKAQAMTRSVFSLVAGVIGWTAVSL